MKPSRVTPAESKKSTQRELAAERTKQEILSVAAEEFSTNGFTGARVDAITERTRTSKATLYYYFGSKEGLYIAVMENVYASIREAETSLALREGGSASEALKSYIEGTFDYHERNPIFSRIISIENINNATYLKKSRKVRSENRTVVQTLKQILDTGARSGEFRTDITPLEMHYLISALCLYRMSNRQTFGTIFEVDFSDRVVADRQKHLAVQTVLSLVTSPP